MIHIILADAELELLPNKEVYDKHLHGEREGSRRGRPDIVHAFLSLCQSSVANHEGKIRTWVHTRNDLVIEAERRAEVPPNYAAFLQLMSQVLDVGGEAGFFLRRETLRALLERIAPQQVVVLTPLGKRTSLEKLLEKEEETVVIIGGFPEGDYLSSAYELATHSVSLGSNLLTVWTVTCQVLCSIPS